MNAFGSTKKHSYRVYRIQPMPADDTTKPSSYDIPIRVHTSFNQVGLTAWNAGYHLADLLLAHPGEVVAATAIYMCVYVCVGE
jgi:hypothetical protein